MPSFSPVSSSVVQPVVQPSVVHLTRVSGWVRVGLFSTSVVFSTALFGTGCDIFAALDVVTNEAPPPNAPQVSFPSDPISDARITLRGSKPASTGIRINGVEAVAIDVSPIWSAPVDLQPGTNTLVIEAFDGRGQASTPVEIVIERDETAPGALDIDEAPDAFSYRKTFTFEGSKDADSAVLVNGRNLTGFDGLTEWSQNIDFAEGNNEFRFAAVDAFGNESNVEVINVERGIFSFVANNFPATSRQQNITISGTRSRDVTVTLFKQVNNRFEEIEQLDGDRDAFDWAFNITLEGDDNELTSNRFRLEAVTDEEDGNEPVISKTLDFTVIFDATKIGPPDLDDDDIAVVTDDPTFILTGTTDPFAKIEVNGAILADANVVGDFAAIVPLSFGFNELTVVAVDGDERSDPVAVAPQIYRDDDGLLFSVDALPPVLADCSNFLSGSRNTDIDIFVNGSLAAASDGASAIWSAPVELNQGNNAIAIQGRRGRIVQTQAQATFCDETVLPPPVINAPEATNAATATLFGIKNRATSVFRDNVQVVGLNNNTTFSDQVSLNVGKNVFVYDVRDASGRISETTRVEIFRDQRQPSIILDEPILGDIVVPGTVVSGTANDDGRIALIDFCIGICDQEGDFTIISDVSAADANGTVSFNTAIDEEDIIGLVNGVEQNLVVRVKDAANNLISVTRGIFFIDGTIRQNGGNNTNNAFDPDVAAGALGTIATSFTDVTGGGSKIFVSLADVTSLVPAALLNINANGTALNSSNARVAVTTNAVLDSVHVIWLDAGIAATNNNARKGLLYSRVDVDANPNVDALLLVADGSTNAVSSPALTACSDDSLAAVWLQNNRVFFSRLTVGASVWSAPLQISDDAKTLNAAAPSIACGDDGFVHIAWQDGGNLDGFANDNDIYYRRVASNNQLSSLTLISGNLVGNFVDQNSLIPAVAAINGDAKHAAIVAWIESGSVNNVGNNTNKAVARLVNDDSINAAFNFGKVSLVGLDNVISRDVDLTSNSSGDVVVLWSEAIAGNNNIARPLSASILPAANNAADVEIVDDFAFITNDTLLDVSTAFDALGRLIAVWSDDVDNSVELILQQL